MESTSALVLMPDRTAVPVIVSTFARSLTREPDAVLFPESTEFGRTKIDASTNDTPNADPSTYETSTALPIPEATADNAPAPVTEPETLELPPIDPESSSPCSVIDAEADDAPEIDPDNGNAPKINGADDATPADVPPIGAAPVPEAATVERPAATHEMPPEPVRTGVPTDPAQLTEDATAPLPRRIAELSATPEAVPDMAPLS